VSTYSGLNWRRPRHPDIEEIGRRGGDAMGATKPTTPAEYLASLEPERRKVVNAVRSVVKKHLPKGYVEAFNWGMLAYEVPLRLYPDTYNQQPFMYLALASQKSHYALHMMVTTLDQAVMRKLAAAYQASGKKLTMGKGCLRFKSLDDLPLEAVGELVAAIPVERCIELAKGARSSASRT
jgi:hypothetical protein